MAAASTSESASQLFMIHGDGMIDDGEFEKAIALADRVVMRSDRLCEEVVAQIEDCRR
jgi:hypothetical protein